jgi:hypothetical protein
MSSIPDDASAPRPVEAQGTAILAAIGAWTIVVPFLGNALGLSVNVRTIVEVVDHVVPGALVLLVGLLLHARARRASLDSDGTSLFAAGVGFLAGFWVLATHVPLLADAARSALPWDAAIWHSIAALPMLGVALWCVLRAMPDP